MESFREKNKVYLSIGVALLLILGSSLFFFKLGSKTANQTTHNKDFSSLTDSLTQIENGIPTEAGKTNFVKQSNNLTQFVDPELVDLDSQIITCDSNVDNLMSSSPNFGGSCVSANGGNLQSAKGKFLGGQCCGALTDTTEYHANLKKLQAYKAMPNIPLDPMHTPVEMAKMWIDYDNKTTLTQAQQKIYDEAYAISKEKPCCCKCWHYYTNEGIAKKMIMDGQFNSKEIADYWDASAICGV